MAMREMAILKNAVFYEFDEKPKIEQLVYGRLDVHLS